MEEIVEIRTCTLFSLYIEARSSYIEWKYRASPVFLVDFRVKGSLNTHIKLFNKIKSSFN